MLLILGVELDTVKIIALLCCIRLAMLLPLPGGIGSIEAAILFYFQALSLDGGLAFGLIALFRFRDVVLLGIGFSSLHKLQHHGQKK